MRAAAVLAVALALALSLAACGGGDDGRDRDDRPASTPTPVTSPPAEGAQAREGRQLVAQSGCFACHRIGGAGNDGPGPDLTDVGARMPAPAIARALVSPTPPMPSFKDLPERDRRAIVAYLTQLHG